MASPRSHWLCKPDCHNALRNVLGAAGLLLEFLRAWPQAPIRCRLKWPPCLDSDTYAFSGRTEGQGPTTRIAGVGDMELDTATTPDTVAAASATRPGRGRELGKRVKREGWRDAASTSPDKTVERRVKPKASRAEPHVLGTSARKQVACPQRHVPSGARATVTHISREIYLLKGFLGVPSAPPRPARAQNIPV